jgi:hypothetical protein
MPYFPPLTHCLTSGFGAGLNHKGALTESAHATNCCEDLSR